MGSTLSAQHEVPILQGLKEEYHGMGCEVMTEEEQAVVFDTLTAKYRKAVKAKQEELAEQGVANEERRGSA
ncbi:hypothetical protein TeGR_g13699 [Tetraparma gracilis]|uniref:Uncharacterized protein n=1 Tax=Tetraparma gracilis TaxID=2962635 RepID=A0ABQ6N0K2_9STRA|nr:hypothetical protein TeGR_g13699 [Tetraparma gracilis]